MSAKEKAVRLAKKLFDLSAEGDETKLLAIAMMLDYTPQDEDDLEDVIRQLKSDISATVAVVWNVYKIQE